MKKVCIILLLALLTLGVKAQSFEGTITYVTELDIMGVMGADKTLKSKLKSEVNWIDTVRTTYKGGYYKQLNISSKKNVWNIYRSDSAKLYSFEDGEKSDFCIVKNTNEDTEFQLTGKMPSISLLDTIVEYKEYKLQMVEVKWKSGKFYYLFDKNYLIANPEKYKEHVYDGFYEYLKIAKSYPIVIIKEMGGVTKITISMIDFVKNSVEDSIFAIPDLESINDVETSKLEFGTIMKIKK